VMNEDGTMARVPDLVRFCAEHGLKMVTVADLIRYRLQHERHIHRAGEAVLPTPYGEFRMIAAIAEVDHISNVLSHAVVHDPVGLIGEHGIVATELC